MSMSDLEVEWDCFNHALSELGLNDESESDLSLTVNNLVGCARQDVEQLKIQNQRLTEQLTVAANGLRKCRYSEQALADQCFALINYFEGERL